MRSSAALRRRARVTRGSSRNAHEPSSGVTRLTSRSSAEGGRPRPTSAARENQIFADPASADWDPSRLRLPGLRQGQRQHAVLELRADAFLVDLPRERERARVVADIVFGIDGLHALVFAEVDLALHLQ